jgi:DNA invertase Pin-like site-specific DNA recombinase
VSTEHDAQVEAFGRQISFYDSVVSSHKNWKIVTSYSDKTSGTNTKKRDGFKQMIQDAKNGKFDLIITREVCRFARNTVDSLEYTRLLNQYGVEVYFINDNIWSMDSDGELRLTIFSALAQDESRKVSERVRSGQAISRQNGQLYGSGNILGYDLKRGERSIDNTYVINEQQAETVRMIYDLYLQGHGQKEIAAILIEQKREDTKGNVRWTASKVSRILSNFTYCGYLSYNKSITTNYLTHERMKNTDES